MSKHESELRRRLAVDDADIYDTITCFLAAIDAQPYKDGKPGQPDLSEYEYEVLTANIEPYRRERLKRMSVADLFNSLAMADPDPNQPKVKVEVSSWSDQQLIEGCFISPSTCQAKNPGRRPATSGMAGTGDCAISSAMTWRW